MALVLSQSNKSYIHSQIWNDSFGCKISDTWKKKFKGKWINITKAEYESIK